MACSRVTFTFTFLSLRSYPSHHSLFLFFMYFLTLSFLLYLPFILHYFCIPSSFCSSFFLLPASLVLHYVSVSPSFFPFPRSLFSLPVRTRNAVKFITHWRLLSSEMWRHVVWWNFTKVSEVLTTFFFRSEDRGSRFVGDIGKYLQNCTALHARKQISPSRRWEP